MNTHCLNRIVLASVGVLLGGCVAGPQEKPAVVTPPAIASAEAPRVPVIYSPFSKPADLSKKEMDEILSAANAVKPVDRAIWFVFIRYHTISQTVSPAAAKDDAAPAGESTYRAVVYFTPDISTARYRGGKCAWVDNFVDTQRRREQAAKWGEQWPPLEGYAQVLARPANGTPGELPEVPAGQIDALPFAKPKNVTDDAMVQLIDAARTIAGRADAHQPVLSVGVEGAIARVWFGKLNAPEGGGNLVTLHKTEKGYQADPGVGFWAP